MQPKTALFLIHSLYILHLILTLAAAILFAYFIADWITALAWLYVFPTQIRISVVSIYKLIVKKHIS